MYEQSPIALLRFPIEYLSFHKCGPKLDPFLYFFFVSINVIYLLRFDNIFVQYTHFTLLGQRQLPII